jgi:hypothetical protein
VRIVDDAILGIDYGVPIHDGYVPSDSSGQTVTYPLPYAVYYSSVGDEHTPRLSGGYTRTAVFFSITYVGATRDQAKWAGELIRGQLSCLRLTLEDRRTWLVELDESQRVRRDDDAIRPDGLPLFYGVDNYAVSITKSPVRPGAA